MTEQNTIPSDDDYISTVLQYYVELPETPSYPRPPDRHCASELRRREIPLATIESALLLASARRLGRSSDAPPLPPIRSLAYFVPIVEELLEQPLPDGYGDYLRKKVRLLGERYPGKKRR
jgi:hypothetical protein